MRLIRKSYEIVSPESAADGDIVETGWIDRKGYPIEPDEDDIEEYGNELAAIVALTKKYISYTVEASDYPKYYPSHTWYTSADADIDYRTGNHTRYSWFLDGFSDDEQRAVYRELT